jgi:hypothetical protein
VDGFRITHHFLTFNDEDNPIIEVEECTDLDLDEIVPTVAGMIADPGGASGTTITITIGQQGLVGPL